MRNPLADLLRSQEVAILDGALATELERRGADLSGGLWSARLLREDPALVRAVHLDYLRAGADVLISASYQASFEGFARHGIRRREAIALFRRSVELAAEAREIFLDEIHGSERCRPLLAASIGPYGASLADGSEYTGAYGIDEHALAAFHRERLEVLSASGADLLACETLPSGIECRALARLLAGHEGPPAWVSFSCRDDAHLADGTPLDEAVGVVRDLAAVVAVGVNCTAPRHVVGALEKIAASTTKPLVAYPNSGEAWDARRRLWVDPDAPFSLAEAAEAYVGAGARLVGGCCRTCPADIAELRQRLLPSSPPDGA